MISQKNTLIGYLVETSGSEFVAQLISDQEGFVPELTIDDVNIRIGAVGSYLMVRQSGSFILVIVEGMWQEVDDNGVLQRMIKVNPLGQITARGGFDRGVALFPSTGAEMHLVTTENR